ncbi:MAG: hypothetical protein Q8P89_02570 [bacterium]|nr:hypothetical protein [bacterium]
MEQQSPALTSLTQTPNSKPERDEFPLREIEERGSKNFGKTLGLTLGAVIIIALGVFTGNRLTSIGQNNQLTGSGDKPKIIKSGKVVGSTDTKTFRDSAEGVLEKGGIDGEGSHHLVRDKDRPDQNAYLTSSIIDMDQYVGKKVKVWGETFSAQKAGWLMDVGKIELLE